MCSRYAKMVSIHIGIINYLYRGALYLYMEKTIRIVKSIGTVKT